MPYRLAHTNSFKLYKPYSTMRFFGILRREKAESSWTRLMFAGMPAVVLNNAIEWVQFDLISRLFVYLDKTLEVPETTQVKLDRILGNV
jgi:hypothetical protein